MVLDGGDKLKLERNEFLKALNRGDEIEVCFYGKWYFFCANKKNKAYLFHDFLNHNTNMELIFNSELELMKMKIQNYPLDQVLDNLEDYTIY